MGTCAGVKDVAKAPAMGRKRRHVPHVDVWVTDPLRPSLSPGKYFILTTI